MNYVPTVRRVPCISNSLFACETLVDLSTTAAGHEYRYSKRVKISRISKCCSFQSASSYSTWVQVHVDGTMDSARTV